MFNPNSIWVTIALLIMLMLLALYETKLDLDLRFDRISSYNLSITI